MTRWQKGAILPLILAILWEMSARLRTVKYESHSSPSEILTAGFGALRDGTILQATWQTFEASLFGLVLAIVVGVAVGALVGTSQVADRAVSPTVEGLRPIPAVALIPLTLLMFGYGLPMEGLIVAYACIWPILIATADATRRVEPRLIEVAMAMEMTPYERMTKVVLPAALARILVGIRVAVGFALVVAVTVEIAVNPRGLGYSLVVAQQRLEIGLMYAQLLWLGLLGIGINALISRLDAAMPGRTGGTG